MIGIIDGHMHLIEHITTFCGKGEGRPKGKGKISFATGEVIQLIPEGMGDFSFTAENCIKLMDQHNIELSVLLQSGFYGFQNEYVAEVTKKYPNRFYPVGGLDPFCKDRIMILDNFVNKLGISALKFEISEGAGLVSYHPGFKIDGTEMQDIYQFAEQHRMTISFDVGGPRQSSYQIKELANIFNRYKKINFVVCHLLAPKKRNQPNWEEEIKMLTSENVWFDFASLPFNIKEPYPFITSIEYIEKVAEIAGVDRLIWGSDAPFVLSCNSYKQLKEYCLKSKKLSSDDIEKLFRNNARLAYNIPYS